jgi:hypothetical protein
MLQFLLEMGGDGTKCCRKMKWWQRACLSSMGRKRDPARGVMTSARGEAVPEREKRGDDASWVT